LKYIIETRARSETERCPRTDWITPETVRIVFCRIWSVYVSPCASVWPNECRNGETWYSIVISSAAPSYRMIIAYQRPSGSCVSATWDLPYPFTVILLFRYTFIAIFRSSVRIRPSKTLLDFFARTLWRNELGNNCIERILTSFSKNLDNTNMIPNFLEHFHVFTETDRSLVEESCVKNPVYVPNCLFTPPMWGEKTFFRAVCDVVDMERICIVTVCCRFQSWKFLEHCFWLRSSYSILWISWQLLCCAKQRRYILGEGSWIQPWPGCWMAIRW